MGTSELVRRKRERKHTRRAPPIHIRSIAQADSESSRGEWAELVLGGPLITITLRITAILATYTTMVLWLAFFPTQRNRSWILARAERKQTAA